MHSKNNRSKSRSVNVVIWQEQTVECFKIHLVTWHEQIHVIERLRGTLCYIPRTTVERPHRSRSYMERTNDRKAEWYAQLHAIVVFYIKKGELNVHVCTFVAIKYELSLKV